MSIFDASKACVASEVQVRVTLNGEAVKHAKVVRKVEWDNVGDRVDSVETDQNGRFSFPVIYMRSLTRSILPLEFVAKTLIQIEVNDESYRIFYAIKRSEEPDDEFGGRAGVLNCELNDLETLKEFGATLIKTRCTW